MGCCFSRVVTMLDQQVGQAIGAGKMSCSMLCNMCAHQRPWLGSEGGHAAPSAQVEQLHGAAGCARQQHRLSMARGEVGDWR